MISKGIAAVCAAWAALAATGAYAAQASPDSQRCFTPTEAESVVTLVGAPAVRIAGSICRPTLGAGSYFATRGDALAARFEAESGAAWPSAAIAVRKVSGMKLPDAETVKPILAGLVGAALATKIKPDSCRDIDRMLATLDPLPVRNLSQLLVQLIQLKMLEKPNTNFSICRSQS